MSQLAYEPCPCGSGKKTKFCCAKNLTTELEPVLRALQGEQRVSALDQLQRLREKHPDHPALLALEGECLLELGEVEQLRTNSARFLRAAPENPVAHAFQALLACHDDKPAEAVRSLQSALRHAFGGKPGTLSHMVYISIGMVARLLMNHGEYLGAQAHLVLQSNLSNEQDSTVVQSLVSLLGTPTVPSLLKYADVLSVPPEGAAWEQPATEALTQASSGDWMSALDGLEGLVDRHPGKPDLTRNLAFLYGRLARKDAAAAAFRAFSQIEGIDQDDAIDAEAIAQVLALNLNIVDEVQRTYDVSDGNLVQEQLLADNRAVSLPVNPPEDSEGPPPRAVFQLLDRPKPESPEVESFEDVPTVIGTALLYGKQTDREARIELLCTRANVESSDDLLTDMLGDQLSESQEDKVLNQSSIMESIFGWESALHPETPLKDRQRLHADRFRHALLQDWPHTALPQFNGKTATEVSQDERYQVRLLASILVLETSLHQPTANHQVFNELREQLGLPSRQPIDPATQHEDIAQIPPSRWDYLEIEKLDDEKLLRAFALAHSRGLPATIRLAKELLERSDDPSVRSLAYQRLVQQTANPEEAMQWINAARDEAAKNGQSQGEWYLAELTVHIRAGDGAEVGRLVKTIQTKFQNEPRVIEALFHILVNFGLVSPESLGPAPPTMGPAGMAPDVPVPASTPAAVANDSSEIWTPGEPAADAGGEKKSKLWLPGMD